MTLKNFLILFLVIISILTTTLILICSQVTLPGQVNKAPIIKPLPLTDTVARLPNGNLVQFVGYKFMAPAAIEVTEEPAESREQNSLS